MITFYNEWVQWLWNLRNTLQSQVINPLSNYSKHWIWNPRVHITFPQIIWAEKCYHEQKNFITVSIILLKWCTVVFLLYSLSLFFFLIKAKNTISLDMRLDKIRVGFLMSKLDTVGSSDYKKKNLPAIRRLDYISPNYPITAKRKRKQNAKRYSRFFCFLGRGHDEFQLDNMNTWQKEWRYHNFGSFRAYVI